MSNTGTVNLATEQRREPMHAIVSRKQRFLKQYPTHLAAIFSARLLKFLIVLAVAGAFLQPQVVSAGDLALEDCISAALEKNPSANAAAYRVDATRAMLKQVRSAYYPQVFLSGDYTLTDNPTRSFMMQLNQRQLDIRDPAFDPNDPGNTDNFRFSLGLKYRIYDGGKRRAQSTSAKLGSEAAEYLLSSFQNELIHQVTRGYYSVLQAQDFVGVQQESVKSLEKSLAIAGERVKAGSAVKTDVLNLEVQLAQAREDLIRAENSVKLAIAALNTSIGKELVTEQNLPAPQKGVPGPVSEQEDFKAVENRPELQAAHRQTLIKEQSYRKSVRDYIPIVNAYGSYDVDSEELSDFEGSYIVGVMAEWEIFDGFRRPGAVDRTRAEWEAARQSEENVRNNLKLDLRRAYIQAGEGRQRLAVAQKSVVSAEESLRITTVRYKEGAAPITELLTAEVGLTATHSRNVAAHYDYLIALSNVARARGDLIIQYRNKE